MFYYKKSLAIVAGLVLGLLSLNAGAPPIPMERFLYKGYDKVILEGYSNEWVQRIIGWRVDYTCRIPEGCHLTVLMSPSMMASYTVGETLGACTGEYLYPSEYYYSFQCPNRTKVYLLHENFVIPPACTMEPVPCED